MRAALPLLLLLSGCAFTYGRTTAWRSPSDTQLRRLVRIQEAPSQDGVAEALKVLSRGKHETAALAAIEAGLPDAMGPIEQQLLDLSPDVRAKLYTVMQRIDDPRPRRLLLRAALELGEGQTDAAVAMSGRTDQESVDGLIKLTEVEDIETRVTAAAGLAKAAEEQAPVRTLLLELVRSGPPRLTNAALTALAAPDSDTEVEVAIAASKVDATAVAAMRFLAAADPMPDAAQDRLAELLGSDNLELRWPATKALARKRFVPAMEPLVAFLDDDERKSKAQELLVIAEEAALPALRAHGAKIQDKTSRWVAAQRLAEIGAPSDAELVGKLAEGRDAGEVATVVDRVKKWSPGALFPKGVTYYEGRRAGEEAVTRTLEEAMAIERRAVVGAKADPGRRYVSLARIYLMGARSPKTIERLQKTAKKLENERAFFFRGSLGLQGYNEESLRNGIAKALEAHLPKGWTAKVAAPPTGMPSGYVEADIRCTSRKDGKTSEGKYTHEYDAWSPNPERVKLQNQINALPGAVDACYVACGAERLPCGADGAAGLRTAQEAHPDVVCQVGYDAVDNPEVDALRAKMEALPPRISKRDKSIGTKSEVKQFEHTDCKGRIEVRINRYERSTGVRLRSSKVTTTTNISAAENDFYGKAVRVYKTSEGPVTTDERPRELAAGLKDAVERIGGPIRAEANRAIRAAVNEASREKDVRAARTLALWTRPELVKTEVEELDAFRRVFLSTSGSAFRVR